MITIADLHTRAVLPPAHVVCGIELVPLTVGHARVLSALELWAPDNNAELLLAAIICSGSVKDFRCQLQSKWLHIKARLWAWRLGKSFDYECARKVWSEYLSFHTDQPVALCKGKPRSALSPMHAILKVRLCQNLGYRPETFDDVPYIQALLDYWTLAEAEDAAILKDYSVQSLREAVRN